MILRQWHQLVPLRIRGLSQKFSKDNNLYRVPQMMILHQLVRSQANHPRCHSLQLCHHNQIHLCSFKQRLQYQCKNIDKNIDPIYLFLTLN